MEIGSRDWIDLVTDGAARMGITLDRSQADRFALHGRRLLEWNQKINLTAITDPGQIAVKHFLDAIAPLNHIPTRGRLLDIGTGGGFPGLPLKVMIPHMPMTLIDSVRKKISFVKQMIRQLGLHSIEALHARAEELAGKAAYAQGFQVIVCRALADMDSIVKLAAPLLAPGGRIIAYKGPRPAGETFPQNGAALIDYGDRQFQTALVSYRLPLIDDPRSIAVLTSSS